jgi:hypothetical protein
MTGIVTALETYHGRCAISEQVNNLALALVAPLTT